jgi:hypothetical protein
VQEAAGKTDSSGGHRHLRSIEVVGALYGFFWGLDPFALADTVEIGTDIKTMLFASRLL